MFINLYITRSTYHFILIYTCGLTVVIKRRCYVMLFLDQMIRALTAHIRPCYTHKMAIAL